MLVLTTPPAEAATPNPGQRSFREVCQAAIRVFDLMGKYKTAPYPRAYAVLFAYVSGSDARLIADVNDLLLLKEHLSPFDVESLYQEYLSEDIGAFAVQDIGAAIGNEIGAVRDIIEKSLKQNDDFTATLDTFAGQSLETMSSEHLAAAVTGLTEENRRMADLTRQLNQGLAASQGLIGSLYTQLEDLKSQSLRDPSTSLLHRRAFEKHLEERLSKPARSADGYCLIRAEIDGIKALTDSHGPLAEEAAIQCFAALVASALSEDDVAARYGAHDFAILLPGRSLMHAYNLAVRIKHGFKLTPCSVPGTAQPIAGMTASFGVAHFPAGVSPETLLGEAETHLRDAKASGRNLIKARGLA